MKKLTTEHHEIIMYASIDEMPIERFHKFNKFLLIDAGIGSTLNDFDGHIAKVIGFLQRNDSESAIKELENTRTNVFMVLNGLSPKLQAFAAMVKCIDGEEVNDLSDENLSVIAEKLKDESVMQIVSVLEETRKK